MKTNIGIKSVDKLLLLAFFAGLTFALLFGYTRSWTESTPTDATVANQIDDFNRYLRVDVAERLETYIGGFNASDSNAGFYQLLLLEQASFSTPAANKYVMGGKLVAGKCELVGKDEDGDEIQLSYTGKHMIGSGTAPQAFQYNTTEEDGDGGRESTIRAKGEQSGGEVTTLGYVEFSHEGSSDDEKGQLRIFLNDTDDGDAPTLVMTIPSTGVAPTMAESTAPAADAQLANKKYVDDHVGHDGDGYVLVDVGGTPTKVYTKYLTGTLDADSQTNVTHSVTSGATKILAVVGAAYDDNVSKYTAPGHYSAAAERQFILYWDDTVVRFDGVGEYLQGNGYKVRIDYIL